MHRNCLKYIKNYFNLDLNELHKKERVGSRWTHSEQLIGIS